MTYLSFFDSAVILDKILKHFISLTSLIHQHRIVRHGMTYNCNGLPFLLQVIRHEASSLTLPRSGPRRAYCNDGLCGSKLSEFGRQLNELASGGVHSGCEGLDRVVA